MTTSKPYHFIDPGVRIGHVHLKVSDLRPGAVAVAFAACRFPLRSVPAYVFAQLAGACAVSGVLRTLFPSHATLGATFPAGNVYDSTLVIQRFWLHLIAPTAGALIAVLLARVLDEPIKSCVRQEGTSR